LPRPLPPPTFMHESMPFSLPYDVPQSLPYDVPQSLPYDARQSLPRTHVSTARPSRQRGLPLR
jgi:hypothetical protein